MISRQQWLFMKLVSGFSMAAVVAVIVLRIGYLMDRGSWLNTLTVPVRRCVRLDYGNPVLAKDEG